MPRFEVQTAFIGTWENCWTVDGEPQTFASEAEAEAAINEHLADVAEAVKAGDMVDGYTREDFRVVPAAESA